MNTYVRNAILVGLGLLLFIPIIVTPSTFFPYIVGKAFFFRVITGILLILWTWLVLSNRSYLPRWKTPVFLSFGFLLIVTLVSAFFGVDTTKSIWSNFERMEGWITYLHLFALFVIVSSVMTREKWWVWLFHGFALMGVWVSLVAFSEYAGGNTRPDATLGNSTYLAGYLLFSIFFILLLSWRRYKSTLGGNGFKVLVRDWVSWVYAVFLAIQVWALFLTQTRGTLLGLLGGVFISFAVIAIWGKGLKRARTFSTIVLATIVILVGTFFVFKDTQVVQSVPTLERFANISLTEGTAVSRLTLWKMVGEAWKERPLLGWGQGNFIHAFSSYYDPSLYNQEPWFDRSHNVFFDWLVSTGILGLATFVSVLIAAFVLLWRSRSDFVSKSLLSGLLIGYVIHNMFVFDVLTTLIPLVLLLSFITYLYYGESTERDTPLFASSGTSLAVGVIATALLLVGVYSLNVPWFQQSKHLLSAVRAVSSQDIANAQRFAEKAFNAHPVGDVEAGEQMAQFTGRAVTADGMINDEERVLVGMTMAHLDLLISKNPDAIRPQLFAGLLLHQIGDSRAVEYLEEARDLAPDKQPILFALSDAYFANNDPDKAKEVLKHAYEVAPEYPEARMRYAAALIRTGNLDEGEDLLEENDLKRPHPILVLAYVEANRYDRAIAILHTLQKNDPDNGQIYISLATAYRNTGNITQAKAVLEAGINNVPAMKEQFEALIDSIE